MLAVKVWPAHSVPKLPLSAKSLKAVEPNGDKLESLNAWSVLPSDV
jgi:hypothetical protein